LSKAGQNYIGVRLRPGSKFGAEIIDPETGKRVWLRTYNTPEEAATTAYDLVARSIKPNAKINIPHLEEDGKSVVAVLGNSDEVQAVGQADGRSQAHAVSNRKTVIRCVLSEAVHVESLSDHISITAHNLNYC
jgi:type IV secretory pathway TrbF-like protein